MDMAWQILKSTSCAPEYVMCSSSRIRAHNALALELVALNSWSREKKQCKNCKKNSFLEKKIFAQFGKIFIHVCA